MEDLTIAIVALVVLIVVFLVLREFWTWYWKINQLIDGQKKTNMLLQQMLGQNNPDVGNDVQAPDLLIQNTTTGKTTGISRSEWDNLLATSPQQKKYKIIKENKPE